MAEDLTVINVEIANAETNGDRGFFDALLAPAFAFQRASGAFETREIFLAGVKRSSPRTCDPKSVKITPLSSKRAFVTCDVVIQQPDGPKKFHNARLFIQDGAGDWRLLAWANEVGLAG